MLEKFSVYLAQNPQKVNDYPYAYEYPFQDFLANKVTNKQIGFP